MTDKQKVYDELGLVIGAIGKRHTDQETTILCLHALNLLIELGE